MRNTRIGNRVSWLVVAAALSLPVAIAAQAPPVFLDTSPPAESLPSTDTRPPQAGDTEVMDESGGELRRRDDETPATNRVRPRAAARQTLIASLSIFVLAVFVGFEVIAKVPPTLHTPLMSGSNAISGITVVGAVLVAAHGYRFSTFLGFFAVILAMINVVGGFMVTHRMLAMFKRK